jgi:hypothetical protein
MALCPSCKADKVYNSGFTIECVNPACRFFSQAHKDACLGQIPRGLKIQESPRKLSVGPTEMVETVRVSSATTPVAMEMCYTADDGQSFTLARWASDTLLECRVNGNAFSAELSVSDQSSEHLVKIEFMGASGTKLYTTSVSFSQKDKKFEVNSMT